jgi:hypothetical protein
VPKNFFQEQLNFEDLQEHRKNIMIPA